MTAQELIDTIRTATPAEIATLRALLRVPDADYSRREFNRENMPRDLGKSMSPGSHKS